MNVSTDGSPAGGAPAVHIRPLEGFEELTACVELQEAVWGRGFSERVPSAMLRVAQRLGGVVAGAFDPAGTLLGFVFGLTGLERGEPVHWSDMLAVRPGIRDAGLGRALKEYQRRTLLEAGVRRAYWSFDPLQSRNGYLNIVRLGAVSREYVVDMYGAQTDSPLHVGLGTDRLVALWLLDSTRVRDRLAREGADAGSASAFAEAPSALEASGRDRWPEPAAENGSMEAVRVRVAIPADIDRLKADDVELAGRWRASTRRMFTTYMNGGYQVIDFRRGDRLSEYLLERMPAEDRP